MSKVTIKDIARTAGVSLSTVSLALRGSPRVAPATRQRILDVVQRLQYTLNPAGQALKRGFSDMILFCFAEDMDFDLFPVVYKVFDGVLAEAARAGLEVLWSRLDRSDTALQRTAAYRPCGVVAIGLTPDSLGRVRRYSTNVVVIERPDDLADLDLVGVDNLAVGRLAATRITEAGHRRVACLTGKAGGRREAERVDGCLQVLREAGVRSPEKAVLTVDAYRAEAGQRAAAAVLARRSRPTAVFVAAGDPVACGLVQGLTERGLRIPADMSVVGFDGTVAAYCAPVLATVAQPLREFGAVAVRILIQKRDGVLVGMPQRVILPPSWSPGASLAKPPGSA
ncbi:MAG: hypothetical protein A3K19_28945 [Lentisphaerae bacterium RIFOXYB12_FULL_65_16]|nr:MAG: hypothetical protein A3K18_25530 [Lentisphaerae bacterium RIFOXYA12_64_32]OGV88321.1 MAG: hypothetical protein A3K19_28945 [Lentisphaerae bacterium RIFOXYB12_FULL_65_16]